MFIFSHVASSYVGSFTYFIQEYEKKKKEEEKLKIEDVTESHRVAVARFMQKVRNTTVIYKSFLMGC